MLSIVTALVTAQLKIAALQAQNEMLEARPPEVVTEYVTEYVYVPEYVTEYVTETVEVPAPEMRDCGTCGAHVSEWYWIRSEASGCPIEVCQYCYELFIAED